MDRYLGFKALRICKKADMDHILRRFRLANFKSNFSKKHFISPLFPSGSHNLSLSFNIPLPPNTVPEISQTCSYHISTCYLSRSHSRSTSNRKKQNTSARSQWLILREVQFGVKSTVTCIVQINGEWFSYQHRHSKVPA
jgi:hypothetical protein